MSNDVAKLNFIVEKIDDIFAFKSRYETTKELLDDKMGFDATLMCLLQIGENLNSLKNEYDILDKEDIKGTYNVRNFIAHDYEGVNKSIVENIIIKHLPNLKARIEVILNEL